MLYRTIEPIYSSLQLRINNDTEMMKELIKTELQQNHSKEIVVWFLLRRHSIVHNPQFLFLNYGDCTRTSEVVATIVCLAIEPHRKESMKERYEGLKQ